MCRHLEDSMMIACFLLLFLLWCVVCCFVYFKGFRVLVCSCAVWEMLFWFVDLLSCRISIPWGIVTGKRSSNFHVIVWFIADVDVVSRHSTRKSSEKSNWAWKCESKFFECRLLYDDCWTFKEQQSILYMETNLRHLKDHFDLYNR